MALIEQLPAELAYDPAIVSCSTPLLITSRPHPPFFFSETLSRKVDRVRADSQTDLIAQIDPTLSLILTGVDALLGGVIELVNSILGGLGLGTALASCEFHSKWYCGSNRVVLGLVAGVLAL